jgi:RNA polymerase sigma-70 factor (ECF subfamily)
VSVSDKAVMTDAEGVPSDPGARFAALYAACFGDVYRYVHRRRASHPADVPDVVADTFAVAWQRFDAIPDAPADRLWLYGIARHKIMHHQRGDQRRWRLQKRLRSERAPLATPPGDRHDRLRAAIECLRPRDKEVIRLILWDGLSHAEAAQVLRCSVNAVTLRFSKAKRRLYERVTEQSDNEDSVHDPSVGRRDVVEREGK